MTLPYLDGPRLAAALPMNAAIDALERALRDGLDPAADPPRTRLDNPQGQLLLMPSGAAAGFVVKLATIAPANPECGIPLIHGVVVVFDPQTLAPSALVDGIALTALRTPAISALAVKYVASSDARRLVVFGSGQQAAAHIEALRVVRRVDDVAVIGRDADRATALAARVNARVGTVADVPDADLIVCATTSREPLFDGRLVRDGACVVAVGSHEPDAREIDSGLMLRSRVVVEEVATAAREAGELVLAGIGAQSLEPLAPLVRATPSWDATRPTVVKTVGMAWEDAVVASAAVGSSRLAHRQ